MESLQFKKIEQLVKQVLQECPQTRDNSKKLCLEVWRRQGLELTGMQEYIFLKCYSSESVTRAARFWQNDLKLFRSKNPQKDLFMEEEYREHYKK